MYKLLFLFYFLSLQGSLLSQNQIINTTPPGADVFDDKGNKLGETPFNISNIKQVGTKIIIKKEHYDQVEISFTKKNKNIFSFPNSVNECLGCVFNIDSNSGLTNDIKLFKNFKDYNKIIMIGIDIPEIDIPFTEEIGVINNSKKKLKDKDIYRLLGYPENMEIKLLNSFKDSYINAYYYSKKSVDNNVSTLTSPKVIIKPVVKKMNFNLNGQLLRDYTGLCSVDCEWQISDISNVDKIIRTISTKTVFYRSGNNYELILHDMLSIAERDLLESEDLFEILELIEVDYLNRSKGDVYPVEFSNKTTYNNTTEMLKNVVNSVVTVETDDKFGSGVIISNEGHIITNYHVIEGKSEILVKIGKEKKIKVELIKSNKDYDLALLKINNYETKGLTFSNSDSTSVGDEVFAAGTPIDKTLGQTITKGIISGYREYNGVNFIQTDVSINSGNSGGPLLNSQGEIIGINTLKATGVGISGVGFSISSNTVLEMLNIVNK